MLAIAEWKICQIFKTQKIHNNKKRKIMNRSSKGFGLAGVLATVLFLVVTAVMSSSANAVQSEIQTQHDQK